MNQEKLADQQVRLAASMDRLRILAPELNQATDDLGKIVVELEQVIKKLNLGMAAWCPLSKGEEVTRYIGYAKVKGFWCIALKEEKGDHFDVIWPFNEAPRWLRLVSASKFPELLETIEDRAGQMLKEFHGRIAETACLVDSLIRPKI